ncbi:transposase [Methyloversatilis discipulorum]|uniref:transposase n=1 Tax=Methyloversatilis discipulorum TaxID=1119528 RepID=UPI00036E9A42|nr:transposase [Methyloversatilis discipulorum]
MLLGYSRGLISFRSIATACRNNVLFMAVSGDSAPHFTTVAHLISSLGIDVQALFTQVLLLCDREGQERHNKRLTRFTLRGRGKVDGQWKLYCVVHNIEKLGHHGYAIR